MSASSSSASPCRRRRPTTPRRASTSWRCSSTPPAPTRRRASSQRRDRPDPATYIGKGKAEELRELCLEVDADTVVFDNELTPAQQCNLEKLLGRTAIDRTAVILDIFAQNAHSQEGKAQVELALLRYRLPRLRRAAPAGLSPAGGSASARGVPVRRSSRSTAGGCMRRITKLERDLKSLGKHAPHAAQGAHPQPAERRSRSSATRTPASRRCSTGSPTPACSSRTACSPRSTRPRRDCELPGGETVLSPTPSGSSASCRTSSSRRSSRRSRRRRRRPAGARRRRVRARSRRPDRRRAGRAARDRRRSGARAARVQQDRHRPGRRAPRRVAPGLGGDLGDDRRGDRRPPAHDRRPAAGPVDGRRARDPVRPRRRARRGPPGGRGRLSSRTTTTACGCGPASMLPLRAGSPSSRRALA